MFSPQDQDGSPPPPAPSRPLPAATSANTPVQSYEAQVGAGTWNISTVSPPLTAQPEKGKKNKTFFFKRKWNEKTSEAIKQQ